MLREANPAANDGACPDDTETAGAGGGLASRSPSVRRKASAKTAARSRRVPGLDAILAAWLRLPPATQDQLGVQAVATAFYGWLTDDGSQDAPDRWLTDGAVGRCNQRADRALNLLTQIAERSMPELYGTRKQDPAWARSDADPAALEVLWEGALPSPAQSAIAMHRASWRALQASAAYLRASGEWEERSERMWPAAEAEGEALTDVLMVSCRDRVDAEAMVSHLVWYLQARPQHPKRSAMGEADAALIAVRLRDLSMILERDVAGAAAVAEPGTMVAIIAGHREAWSAYRADPEALVRGSVRRVTLIDGMDEASEAVLLAPCGDRAEAADFVEHVAWYRAELEAAGDRLADGFTFEAKQMRARAGDLAAWMASGVRGGRLAAQALM